MRRILFSRWTLSLVGTLLLALLVWLFGPFLAPLSGVVARMGAVAALLLLWAAINAALSWRARRRDAALAEGVAKPDGAAEETAAIGAKLGEAMALLRRARGSRGYLYEQPWYVIIGPPGAGKTTALLNAGLRFPLADQLGQGSVAGVGGTRLCDWWFTDEAVLIDTAGRYTTQDSDAEVDRAGWQAFLALLRRTRPHQPLNGVLVAISLADIAQAPREERLVHAAAIRRRLRELREQLGLRLPVYALFTKADLIAGFSEYFDDLDRTQRAQVWGTTFPLTDAEAGSLAGFALAFRALVERLHARLLDRLQAERSPDRRALIAGFPAQVASLEAPLTEFLEAAFGGSRLDPAPLLRGAYLASGTQEGTPIDRLTASLARSFGLDQRRAPSLRPDQGRSYFLTRLLREVVLGEAMLASEPPSAARRRRLVTAGAYAGVAVALLGGVGLLWRAEAMGQASVAQADVRLAAYRTEAAQLPAGPVTGDDLAAVLPVLDHARALGDGYDTGGGTFGLSQDGKLAAASGLAYRNALHRVLLPRLVARVEARLRAVLAQPDALYDATRVYLMLGGAGPLDADAVRGWMALDWQAAFPGATGAPARDDLVRHLDALLATTLPAIPLDGTLVAQARVALSRVPLAQRVYARIALSGPAQAVAPWRPADALGAAGTPLFVRRSGAALTDGVPGFYTGAGFRGVLEPELPRAAAQVAGESWVLGTQAAVSTAQLGTLEQDVVQLYGDDVTRRWDAVLADLAPAPLGTPAQGAEALYVLGSPQSPLRALFASAVKALTFAAPPVQPAAAKVGVPLPANDDAARALDARFAALRDFVGNGPGAPIDLALQTINGLQQSLARLASAPQGSTAAPPDDAALLALRANAGQAPAPVGNLLLALAKDGTVVEAGGAHRQLTANFNGPTGPATLCAQAIAGRYPFSPGADDAVPLDDFVRLFAPGGLLDGFFTTQLRPLVDTSGRIWKVAATAGAPAAVSTADLAQFQRAAQIRDMFFPAGAQPAIRFTIAPLTLDPGTRQATLDLGGGTTIAVTHAPGQPVAVSWPAQGGASARLTFDGQPGDGQPGGLDASGPWALFRLIREGQLQPQGAPDSFLLTFRQGTHWAEFAVHAGSVLNPLSSHALRDFRCPALN
jgi:type VI secretion system protein ImpL